MIVATLAALLGCCRSGCPTDDDIVGIWDRPGLGVSWLFGRTEYGDAPGTVLGAAHAEEGPDAYDVLWTGEYETDGDWLVIRALEDLGYSEVREVGESRGRIREWSPGERLVFATDPDVFIRDEIELVFYSD